MREVGQYLRLVVKSLLVILLFVFGSGRADAVKDVFAIGQPFFDIYVECSEQELGEIIKNSLVSIKDGDVIDQHTVEYLEQSIIPSRAEPGGAIANTAVGLASLGAKVSFAGVSSQDRYAHLIESEFASSGVERVKVPYKNGGVARSYSFIADGKKSMRLTYDGGTRNITPRDLDMSIIKNYRMVLAEGYLWGNLGSSEVIKRLFDAAEDYNIVRVFTLSSTKIVHQYHNEFQSLLSKVDILIGNYDEYAALFNTHDMQEMIRKIRDRIDVAVITNGNKGAYIVTSSNVYNIGPEDETDIKNKIGVGDAFAAGFLYGYLDGLKLEDAGKLGGKMAYSIMHNESTRPHHNMIHLVKDIQGK
jgi:sugar/nucleoside kinase (ribokinase family)